MYFVFSTAPFSLFVSTTIWLVLGTLHLAPHSVIDDETAISVFSAAFHFPHSGDACASRRWTGFTGGGSWTAPFGIGSATCMAHEVSSVPAHDFFVFRFTKIREDAMQCGPATAPAVDASSTSSACRVNWWLVSREVTRELTHPRSMFFLVFLLLLA